jgi:hypothetical protein
VIACSSAYSCWQLLPLLLLLLVLLSPSLLLLLPTQAFLAPFGLGVYSDSTVSAANTIGNIAGKRAAKVAKHVLLACTETDR